MIKRTLFAFLMIPMLFSTVSYGKTATKENENPGSAIFVMAIPQEIEVIDKVLEKHTKNLVTTMHIPQLQGLENEQGQKEINRFLLNRSKTLQKQAKDLRKQDNSEKINVPYEVISTYTTTEQYNQYLAFRFFDYLYTGGIKGRTKEAVVVIDTKQAKILTLDDLFEEGTLYKEQIDTLIFAQITDRAAKDNLVLDDLIYRFKTQDNQPFYITSNGHLAIVVNLEEVIPDRSGSMTFILDKSSLKGYRQQS